MKQLTIKTPHGYVKIVSHDAESDGDMDVVIQHIQRGEFEKVRVIKVTS